MGYFDELLGAATDFAFSTVFSRGGKSEPKRQSISSAFNSRRVVYGRHLVPGTIIFAHTGSEWQDKRDMLDLVVVFASQHSEFVEDVRFDDVPMLIGDPAKASDAFNVFKPRTGASDREKKALGESRFDSREDYCYQRANLGKPGVQAWGGTYQYYDGTWKGFNNDGLGDYGYRGIKDGWPDGGTHPLYGLTSVFLTLKHDSKVFPDGVPEFSAMLKGKRVLDVRDSQVKYSDNLALCVLDWLLSEMGVPLSRIDTQSFIDAANICDEDADPTGSNVDTRFRVSGILELTDSRLDNLETLLSAGGAQLSRSEGMWSIHLPAYSAPVHSFTESDIIGDLQIQSHSGKQDRINVVKGSYLSADHDFERVEAPVIKSQAYINNDGEKLEATYDYELVDSGYQVERLNKIKMEKSRYGLMVSALFKMTALKVKAGDRISLSVSHLNWNARVFRVLAVDIDIMSGVKLSLKEDAPEIYNWAVDDVIEIDPPQAIELREVDDLAPVDNLTVIEELYQTQNAKDFKVRAAVTITPPIAGDFEFDVEYKEITESEWVNVTPRTYSLVNVISDIKPGDYQFRARCVTQAGFASDWFEITQTIQGKTALPPDIESTFLDSNILIWTYPNPPADLEGFLVRMHNGTRQTWADAIQLHSGIVTDSRFPLPENAGGTKTFLVKAVDTSGNVSANASIVTMGLGDPDVNNIILTYDYKAYSWPGTIADGTINGSNELESSQVGAFYNPDGGSIFYNQTDSALFYDSEFKKLVYEFDYTVSAQDEGSQLTIDATVDAESYQLYVIPPSSVGNTFVSFGGYVPRAEAGLYKFKIVIPSQFGSSVPKITALALNLDVPDIIETFEDISISSSGTRLPITETYRGIRVVSLTMQSDGSGVSSLKVQDKNHTLGPLVYAYNSSGTAVSTTIDATIRGY